MRRKKHVYLTDTQRQIIQTYYRKQRAQFVLFAMNLTGSSRASINSLLHQVDKGRGEAGRARSLTCDRRRVLSLVR